MENQNIERFNIRVYGLAIKNGTDILLADEYVLDRKMTKFPGGGLKFGEGPADCIKREALEEFGQEIEVIDHFYTTDFFQQALFYPSHQLISIYYTIRFTKPIQFRISEKPFDFELKNGAISFRWAKITDIHEQELSFPIDKHVLSLLKKKDE